MPHVRWKLKEYAEARGLTGYVIAKQMLRSSDTGRPATVYRLMGNNPPARVDLDTLSALITALRELLQDSYIEINDLLEYISAEDEALYPDSPRKQTKRKTPARPAVTPEEEAEV